MTELAVTSYVVQGDWARDGTYGHAYADITSYVISMNWEWGMSEPFQLFAPPASGTITLDNSSGAFNVANTGSIFYKLLRKGALVRILANHKSSAGASPVQHQFFVGKLDNVQIDYGETGRRTAVLALADPMLTLLDTPYTPRLLQNVRVDEVLSSMFNDDVVYPYPYATEFWILGNATYGVLGTTTTLFEDRILDLDTAATTLVFAGDQMASNIGTTAQAYMRELTAAEGLGRLYYNGATGKLVFENRDTVVAPPTSTTLSYADIRQTPPQQYDYLGRLANDVTVNYSPRTQGTAGSVIYSMPNPLRLGGNETRTVTARFRDPDFPDSACGALDIITPQPTIDYTANTAENGGGTDITAYIVVTMNAGATSAELIISNGYHQTAYITSYEIRGTPLVTRQMEPAIAVDNTSIIGDGRWPRIVDATLIPADTAQGLANWLIGRDSNPLPALRQITLPWVYETDDCIYNADLLGYAIQLTNDSWAETASTRTYRAIGRQHNVPVLGIHEVSYLLEPIDTSSTCWLLGDSTHGVLGTSTKLYF